MGIGTGFLSSGPCPPCRDCMCRSIGCHGPRSLPTPCFNVMVRPGPRGVVSTRRRRVKSGNFYLLGVFLFSKLCSFSYLILHVFRTEHHLSVSGGFCCNTEKDEDGVSLLPPPCCALGMRKRARSRNEDKANHSIIFRRLRRRRICHFQPLKLDADTFMRPRVHGVLPPMDATKGKPRHVA
jgi:hypothetical protein